MRITGGQRTQAALVLIALCVRFGGDAVRGAEPKKPALNQLVVLDPGMDEKGLPVVQIDENGQVEIPPTIHVHPYYYSGDREYQTQILQGGPTIVVANHPKTNEKMYVDVVLPAGAPVIAYSKAAITYVYPDQRIVVGFSCLFPKKVTVTNLPGRGLGRKLRDGSEKFKEKLKKTNSQSAVIRELGLAAEGTGKVLVGAGGVASKIGLTAIERTRALVEVLPGIKTLKSIADQAPERRQLEEIKQAGLKQAREQTKFLPTNR